MRIAGRRQSITGWREMVGYEHRGGTPAGEGRRLARGGRRLGRRMPVGEQRSCRCAGRDRVGSPGVGTTVSSAGVALLSRVRRVLPTTEGAPGVGWHRGFAECWLLP